MSLYVPPTYATDGPRVGRWMREYVRQTIGRFAGTPLEPEWWQQWFLDELYALDADGYRLNQEGLLCTPKKNGKSTFGAGLGLYMLAADDEQGAEVYVAASRRDQAKVIHNQAKAMVDASPALADWLVPWQNHIECPDLGGIFRVLASDAKGVHGVNPSGVLIDEKWAHPNQDLIVALAGGTGARDEPVTVTMTTVGHDLASPFGEDYVRAFQCPEVERHLDGYLHVCRDRPAGFVAFIFAPPFDVDALLNGNGFQPTVDLEDPEVWAKSNPASWITKDYLLRRRKRTKTEDFFRFHLNAWTESDEFWLPSGAWGACRVNGSSPDRSLIAEGSKVWVAVDMGGKRDCAAVVAVAVVDNPYNPDEPFLYVDAAIIETPPGEDDKVNPAEVRNLVRDVCKSYNVVELCYDPWRFEESAAILADDPALDGVDIAEFPQTNVRMAPASQRLYDAIVNGRVRHNGDRQLASHVAAGVWTETDQGGRLTKRRATKYVDALIALAMAVDRADRARGGPDRSVYEERDLLLL